MCGMRFLGIALVVALPCLSSSSELPDHYAHVPMKEIFEAISRTCVHKTGATLDDLIMLHDYGRLHTTREAKCLAACFLYKWGAMKEEDNTDDKDTVRLYMATAFTPDNMEKAMGYWNTCMEKVPVVEDHCEYVHAVNSCFQSTATSNHLKPRPFWNAYD